MTNDLVSVIIPVYNVASYLDNCIRSAVEQTYRNIEIILIDDGSTDNSPQICDNWAKKDSRIKVIHKKNGGVSAARNSGLDIAAGKYISFLDGDDQFLANTLEVALGSFTEDTDLVSFGYTIVSPEKKDEILFQSNTYVNSTEEDRFNFIIGPFFKYEIGWSVCCNVFLKSKIDYFGLRFQVGHKMAEDKNFCLCYFSHCKKISVINKCLYNYYERSNSVTHTFSDFYFDKQVELSKSVLQHMKLNSDTQLFVRNYPIIHYFILEAEIKKEESRGDLSDLREKIIKNICSNSDIEFFFNELEEFAAKTRALKSNYSSIRILEKKARVKWLLTGHSFWYTILVKLRKNLIR